MSLRYAKNNFAVLSPEYNAQAGRFFREQDCSQLYKGEWARQEKAIRHARDFFKAADLDPFELSDKLAGVDPNQVLTMPDCQARDAVQASIPEEFPYLDENRIIWRAENMVKEIVKTIGDMEKVAAKPVTPVTSAKPMTPVTPVTPVTQKVPLLPVSSPPALHQSSPQSGRCPMTFMELVVCTYAVFVRRFANGKVYPSSGRTIYRVYDNILLPSDMAFDCTREQFKNAVLEGVEKGLVRQFQLKGDKDLYQPTVKGFARAEELYPLLPADFKKRIQESYESVKQVDAGYRFEKFTKKPSS
jgi:hypothetical protein